VPTGCVERADVYRLTSGEAREVVDHQLHVINTQFGDAADAAGLTAAERTLLWGRQILNPYALDGYP
jgi:serine/threonine-protein kinase HipA